MKQFIIVPALFDTSYSDAEFREKVKEVRDNTSLANDDVDTLFYTIGVNVCEAGLLLYCIPKDEEERKKHSHYNVLVPFYDILCVVGGHLHVRYNDVKTE